MIALRPCSRARRVWTAAWTGGAALGVLNGTAREALYAGRVGERAAHQISTATLLAALTGYAAALQRLAPLDDEGDAAAVGATWVGLTLAFELLFGRYVAHRSWSSLLADYDVRRGRVWILVPVAMAVLPAATRRRR